MPEFAVIFDVNGTLIDTEVAHFQGYRDALAEHDVSLSLEQFTDNWSRQGKKLNDYLEAVGRDDLVADYQSIKRRKDDIFQATLSERIALMPGAVDILTRLRDAKVPMAIDTSGSGENMHMMLDLFDLNPFFTHTANGDTVIDEAQYGEKKWKASRLRWLADQFGLPPSQCLMIGDAEKDVLGAHQAGMQAIAVPNQYTRDQDFSLATTSCESLTDITVEMLKNVVVSPTGIEPVSTP